MGELTEFGAIRPAPGLAFGVDERRPQLYSLRQSRYQALAQDIHALAAEKAKAGERLMLLDIGMKEGILRRYLSAWPSYKDIDFYGADLTDPDPAEAANWKQCWVGDLMKGYPDIPSDTFDVVVCEQVLEHLTELPLAMQTLERVLKPGGTLFVGVPIFPNGTQVLRKPLVALADSFRKTPKVRGHVQAFSLASFKRQLRRNTALEIKDARGFRIISGGLLRPLENHRFWWKFNRRLGHLVPNLCIEVQVIARKPI